MEEEAPPPTRGINAHKWKRSQTFDMSFQSGEGTVSLLKLPLMIQLSTKSRASVLYVQFGAAGLMLCARYTWTMRVLLICLAARVNGLHVPSAPSLHSYCCFLYLFPPALGRLVSLLSAPHICFKLLSHHVLSSTLLAPRIALSPFLAHSLLLFIPPFAIT